MSTRVTCLLCVLLFALMGLRAGAEDLPTTKTACHNWAEDKKGYHNLEECVIDIFQLEPFAPAMGNISSGSGTGLGERYRKPWDHEQFQSFLTVRGLYSTSSFYVVDAKYVMSFGPWVYKPHPTGNLCDKKESAKAKHDCETAFFDDARPGFNVKASRIDLRTQDFYGLGPGSTLAGHAVYRQQQDAIGGSGAVPITSWGALGGRFQYFRPEIKGVSGGSLPSVITAYGAAGAPGSTERLDFIQAGLNVGLRTPLGKKKWPWEAHDALVAYDHYSQLGSKQYSFDRLAANGSLVVTGRHHFVKEELDPNQPRAYPTFWQELLCSRDPFKHCTWGTFTTSGLVTASYTGTGSAVPFYLQPTLGGADIDGVDTLRGLVDFRLRAPNRVLLQEAFDKRIWGTELGELGLYVFFDAGNVAMKPGDLSLGNLRKDVGVGISYAVENKIVIRAYYGFGAGEGNHPNAKLPNAF
jgi:hypothetical protein